MCYFSSQKQPVSVKFSSFCEKTQGSQKSQKNSRKKTKGNFVVDFVFCKIMLFAKLTLNDQGDPLADRGRDLVARDAEVGSHLFSGDVLSW